MTNKTGIGQTIHAKEFLAFVEMLRANGRIVPAGTSPIPPNVTHIEHPDGQIERIRFSSGIV